MLVGCRDLDRRRGAQARGASLALDRPHVDSVELDRVDAATLAAEGAAAGLRPLGGRAIPATSDHVGSAVVMLGA